MQVFSTFLPCHVRYTRHSVAHRAASSLRHSSDFSRPQESKCTHINVYIYIVFEFHINRWQPRLIYMLKVFTGSTLSSELDACGCHEYAQHSLNRSPAPQHALASVPRLILPRAPNYNNQRHASLIFLMFPCYRVESSLVD